MLVVLDDDADDDDGGGSGGDGGCVGVGGGMTNGDAPLSLKPAQNLN